MFIHFTVAYQTLKNFQYPPELRIVDTAKLLLTLVLFLIQYLHVRDSVY